MNRPLKRSSYSAHAKVLCKRECLLGKPIIYGQTVAKAERDNELMAAKRDVVNGGVGGDGNGDGDDVDEGGIFTVAKAERDNELMAAKCDVVDGSWQRWQWRWRWRWR